MSENGNTAISALRGFEPEDAHWDFVEFMAQFSGDTPPVSDIADAIDVPAERVHRWLANPSFVAWYEKHREVILRSKVTNVLQVLYLHAMSGSPQHARLFLQRFDPKFGKKPEGRDDDSTMNEARIIEFFQSRGVSKSDLVLLLSGQGKVEPRGNDDAEDAEVEG